MRQLITSLRTLLRFKTYTVINLAGLVFSVACTLIIVRYIHQERTVDYFLPELERTFVMTKHENETIELSGSRNMNKNEEYTDPLDDPCVEMFSRFFIYEEDKVKLDGRGYTVNTVIADSLFLQILPRTVLAGDVSMRNPQGVIIGKRLAERLFMGGEPLGRTLEFSGGEMLTVVAVVDEPSTKASINFDMVVPMALKKEWDRAEYEVVRLHQAADWVALNEKNSRPMELSFYGDSPIIFQLLPLKDFYMRSVVACYYKCMLHGNASSLTILSIVAALLFLVGIFNYINLHTVVMLKRAREFGLKKVFGANGWEVFRQLYFENFCMGAVAVFLVWVVEEATRIPVRDWLGIPVIRDVAFDWWVSAALLLGIPLLTSIFPFLRYNFAPPVSSLRSINMGGNSVVSRTTFIFLQYVITICLIVAAVYFSRQLYYVLNYDVNFKTTDIIRCSIYLDRDIITSRTSKEEYQTYERKQKEISGLLQKSMDESPLFTHWTFGRAPIIATYRPTWMLMEDGSKKEVIRMSCDQPYMEMFGFKLKEGRIWNDEEDDLKQYKVIANEAALRALGAESMHDAKVQFESRVWYAPNHWATNPPFEVVGVVEDFKLSHLSMNADIPVVFYYQKSSLRTDILASIVPGKQAEAIAFLENLYHELNGEGEFEYAFIEDDMAALYKEDERTTHIYITFALIAIFISCLGLFGLSLYDIEQRHREIALRKIHGASTRDIVRLLLRKYYLILGAAFVLASAISYAAIHWYMQDYHHHAPVSWWIFVLAGVIITLISMGTIRWQIHKAVNMNPADVMKSE